MIIDHDHDLSTIDMVSCSVFICFSMLNHFTLSSQREENSKILTIPVRTKNDRALYNRAKFFWEGSKDMRYLFLDTQIECKLTFY